ncbi:MAG: formyltransferase family protein [Pseudomonadota bacterium]
MVYSIGWFSTGRDKAARDLLTTVYQGIKTGEVKASISFVFCNRVFGEGEESDRFLSMVKGYGIDLICCSSRDFEPDMRRKGRTAPDVLEEWRKGYDNEIVKRLMGYTPDINVLAGYMLIVGSEMCQEFDMVNLHPAAPGGPSGTWQEVIWKLIGSNSDKSGVMVHLVTSKLDEGPPITYCTFPIKGPVFDKLWDDLYRKARAKSLAQIIEENGAGNELFMEIRRHGFIRELPLLFQTIRAFADGSIRIEDKKLLMGSKVMREAVCLNKEVESYISREDLGLATHSLP